MVSLYRFGTDDEAVARANDTEYGLNAASAPGTPARGRALAARLRAGTVNVNEGYGPTWGSIGRADGRHGGSPGSAAGTAPRAC